MPATCWPPFTPPFTPIVVPRSVPVAIGMQSGQSRAFFTTLKDGYLLLGNDRLIRSFVLSLGVGYPGVSGRLNYTKRVRSSQGTTSEPAAVPN